MKCSVNFCIIKERQISYVESVRVSPSTKTMTVGQSEYLHEIVCPTNATNKCVEWTSDEKSVATVVPESGLVMAQGVGTAKIRATAQDGSKNYGEAIVNVEPPKAVIGIELCSCNVTMNVGDTMPLEATIFPCDATNQSVIWCSSNENVATIGMRSGIISAHMAGTTTITATTVDGNFKASCELWVHGKTPVFLIHGRTSNSFGTWGAGNRIFTDPLDPEERDNNHYNSSINALSKGTVQVPYVSKNSQDIFSYNLGMPMIVDGVEVENFTVQGIFNGEFKDGKYTTKHPEGGNLAYYLKSRGYKENINLFVFNYPNEDAVVHSAKKFEKYIENLISYVRTCGTDEMKACFYASMCDYNVNNYKINLIGHSMGGLVSRYYIENLNQDSHVDKLITICTPHWGSGYGDLSSIFGTDLHAVCDHDLRKKSNMFGGHFSTDLNCDALVTKCCNEKYILTDELQYTRTRNTKYYAIAGIDYPDTLISLNDCPFEMPTDFTTYQQIKNYTTSKSLFRIGSDGVLIQMDVKNVGDNMVGFMSQIGWTDDDSDSPSKIISMEKIFVNVDTDGGNIEPFIRLHSKVQHREEVMKCVLNYLND